MRTKWPNSIKMTEFRKRGKSVIWQNNKNLWLTVNSISPSLVFLALLYLSVWAAK